MIELVLIALVVRLLGGLGWADLMPPTGGDRPGASDDLGDVLRRALPPYPFVYILGRCFIGTAVYILLAGAVYEWATT